MSLSFLLLQASPGGGTGEYIIMALIGLVFYFFMLRPMFGQIKKEKDQGEFLKNLSKGDEVVTASGIIGRVNKIEGKTITLDVGKAFIPVTLNSISKQMTDAHYAEEDKD